MAHRPMLVIFPVYRLHGQIKSISLFHWERKHFWPKTVSPHRKTVQMFLYIILDFKMMEYKIAPCSCSITTHARIDDNKVFGENLAIINSWRCFPLISNCMWFSDLSSSPCLSSDFVFCSIFFLLFCFIFACLGFSFHLQTDCADCGTSAFVKWLQGSVYPVNYAISLLTFVSHGEKFIINGVLVYIIHNGCALLRNPHPCKIVEICILMRCAKII